MDASPRPRGVIKRAQVSLDGCAPRKSDAPAATAAPASQPCAAPPRIDHAPRARLVELDEHTQAIELTCACGEVSLIEIERPKP